MPKANWLIDRDFNFQNKFIDFNDDTHALMKTLLFKADIFAKDFLDNSNDIDIDLPTPLNDKEDNEEMQKRYLLNMPSKVLDTQEDHAKTI